MESIKENERIRSHMKKLIERHALPHSILFYGPKGVGKMNMAMAVASELLQRPVFAAPEGDTYISFRESEQKAVLGTQASKDKGEAIYIDKGTAFWIRPMGKTGLKIEQWHTLLKEYLFQKNKNERVVIIEDFQTARADFANALLKSIEEPPEGVHFILVTTNKATLLPTILSRCMVIPFVDLEEEKTLTYEGEQSTKELEKTCLLFLQCLGEKRAYYLESMALLHSLSGHELKHMMHCLRLISRDMEALRFGASNELLHNPEIKQTLLSMLPYWTSDSLQVLLRETMDAEEALRLNVRASLVASGLIIALHRAIKEVSSADNSWSTF